MNTINHTIISLLFLLAPLEMVASAQVASPDGRIVFSLAIDEWGTPRYTVNFGDETIINDSRLGLRFETQPGFDSGFTIAGTETASQDESWEQPWGERRMVRDHHNELVLRFGDSEGGDLVRRFNLRVRVFDDGLGFRYEVPAQAGF